MKNKLSAMFLTASLFLSVPVFAHEMSGGYGGGSHHQGMRDSNQDQCPVGAKVARKLQFLLKNEKELGLTQEQIKAIRDLKLQFEKDSVRQNADKQTFMLDLKSKLEEDKIDVGGTNALIDKGFASMAASTKSNLEAYAKLKSTLTADQSAKMKEMKKEWKQSFKKEKGPSTKQG